MKQMHIFPVLLIIFLSQIFACSKEEVTPPPMLEIAKQDLTINFLSEVATKNIDIATNVDKIEIFSDADWCDVSFVNGVKKNIVISVTENNGAQVRTATIEIKAGSLKDTISVTQLGVEPAILLKSKALSVDFKAQMISVEVTTNVDLEVDCSKSWIKTKTGTKSAMVDLVYEFEVEQLQETLEKRLGEISFQHKGGELKKSVTIIQGITTSNEYLPGVTSCFEKDKKIKVISASLSPSDKFQGGEGVEKTIDGDNCTIYHSPWGGMPDKTLITLEYALDPENASVVNYVVLHPRISGSNGIIKSGKVWINTAEDANFVQVGSFDVPQSNNPVVVRFDTPVLNPRNVKIEVTDAYSGEPTKYFVSLAEFECYESKSLNALVDDLPFFTDATCSELQPGTTLADIARIKNPFLQNIAAFMRAGTYPKNMRVQEVEPYRDVQDLARELKTSPYSQFENITGIHFTKEEEVVVFVGDTRGEDIALRVRDFGHSGDDNTYPLSQGVNIITMKGKGNGYINYFTPNYKSAQKIKIHIASGKVNGFFDLARHSNEEGKALLDNAVSEIMDIKGERTQLAFSVRSLTENCYGKMGDLISIYDSIISSEQTMMGLRKYNRLPKNHMFGRVIWEGYMYADGTGAAFNDNTMGDVANPDLVKKSCWGIAHEFGHVNQVRPGMKWVGTTECTNNLYSIWIQYCLTPQNLRLENEVVGGVIGDRFNAYMNSAFVENQEWGLQGGPDDAYGVNGEGAWSADHFVKLCPIWQLHLYFHIAGEGNSWNKPYFWADIFEKVRRTDESGMSDGELQINFVKNLCDAVKMDLSDFFIKVGMLRVIDKYVADYTSAQKIITQDMIDDAVSYVSKYPKPETNYIHYISGRCIDAFKNQLSISGVYNEGISGSSKKRISHSIWKNVTVFETYKGEELTNITMVGTGSSDNSFSQVPYPDGSTRIEAVGWDGTRIKVCGN